MKADFRTCVNLVTATINNKQQVLVNASTKIKISKFLLDKPAE